MRNEVIFSVNIFASNNNLMLKKTPLSERIAAIMSFYNLSAKAFAIKIGIHYGTVQKMTSGNTKEISGEVAEKIITAFPDLSIRYVYIGMGQMHEQKEKVQEVDTSALTEKIKTLTEQLTMAMRVNQLLEEKVSHESKDGVKGAIDMVMRLESKLYDVGVFKKPTREAGETYLVPSERAKSASKVDADK